MKHSQLYTAADLVLMAAAELVSVGSRKEFSEWALTVKTWRSNHTRFGLRGGHETEFPDHKRVMMELSGAKGLVQRGYLARSKPNFYRVTPEGMAQAAWLRSLAQQSRRVSFHWLHQMCNHPVLVRWIEDPDYPRDIDAAREFLGGASLGCVKSQLQAALRWCNSEGVDRFQPDRGDRRSAILHSRIAETLSFLTALVYRFPDLERTHETGAVVK